MKKSQSFLLALITATHLLYSMNEAVHKCHKYASTNPKEVQLQLSTSVGLKYI